MTPEHQMTASVHPKREDGQSLAEYGRVVNLL